MVPFNFTRAGDPGAAIAQHDSYSQYIAGGTCLLDLMKLHAQTPRHLIDINALPLDRVEEYEGGLRIGALVRNTDLALHPLICARYPLLSEALLSGASGQLRNMATVGGNIMQRTRCPYFRDTAFRCNKREPGSGCDAIGGYNRMHAVLGVSPHCIAVMPSDMCVALAALDAVIHTQGPALNMQASSSQQPGTDSSAASASEEHSSGEPHQRMLPSDGVPAEGRLDGVPRGATSIAGPAAERSGSIAGPPAPRGASTTDGVPDHAPAQYRRGGRSAEGHLGATSVAGPEAEGSRSVASPAPSERSIPFVDFHLLPEDHPERETVLEPGELITAVEIPDLPWARHSRYLKLRDRASYAFALVSVAAALNISGGFIHHARLALGGVGTKPWRAYEAERSLIGMPASAESFRAAASIALRGATPFPHNAFKIELAQRAIVRTLLEIGALP